LKIRLEERTLKGVLSLFATLSKVEVSVGSSKNILELAAFSSRKLSGNSGTIFQKKSG